MYTADHPQIDGLTERANRVVTNVLRTNSTSKECGKHLTLVKFAINNSVHATKGGTPFNVDGLRHPLISVSLSRIPDLSGEGPHYTRSKCGRA